MKNVKCEILMKKGKKMNRKLFTEYQKKKKLKMKKPKKRNSFKNRIVSIH